MSEYIEKFNKVLENIREVLIKKYNFHPENLIVKKPEEKDIYYRPQIRVAYDGLNTINIFYLNFDVRFTEKNILRFNTFDHKDFIYRITDPLEVIMDEINKYCDSKLKG